MLAYRKIALARLVNITQFLVRRFSMNDDLLTLLEDPIMHIGKQHGRLFKMVAPCFCSIPTYKVRHSLAKAARCLLLYRRKSLESETRFHVFVLPFTLTKEPN